MRSMLAAIALVVGLSSALPGDRGGAEPRSHPASGALGDGGGALAVGSAEADDSYTLFESAHVRPLALSPDGQRLFAVNTPDNRLEILDVGGRSGVPVHVASVPVGLEPVAVAVRDGGEVWVVNHVSDSISVVDVRGPVATVRRTLLVGDEPRDIVFAGPRGNLAFITTAHRGQNSPVDTALTTQGVPRADVWVFDAEELGARFGGEPLTILELFGDTPRALAASPDGRRVYAAVFRSGNRTTTLPPANLTKSPPHESADGVPAPDSGLIVQHDGTDWVDDAGGVWNGRVGFSLPDADVFEIAADAAVPHEVGAVSGVGTILFNMVVNPIDGSVYVSNTEARNLVRFSGLGQRADSTVRGRFVDHRVSILRDGVVVARDLNPHLDFRRREGTRGERRRSLASPMGMAVSPDGRTLYVAAFGSNEVAFLRTAALDDGTYKPRLRDQVALAAGGPTGLALDAQGKSLYVFTRYDNGVSVIDTGSRRERGHVVLPTPEPREIIDGRPFLYDATLTSGRGNGSCASCHLFGDNDALAWDLGDPDGRVRPVTNDYIRVTEDLSMAWHPMKGPMATQSMRGLANHGPMHWRGDRSGSNRSAGESVEEAAFKEFNEAFVLVQGRRRELSARDMDTFTRFAMRLTYPPNPIRRLDNTLDATQRGGRLLYMGLSSNSELEVCVFCHPIDAARGVFGTEGLMASNGQPGERDFKIPHFRDQYQKIGMFSWSVRSGARLGNQVRGFGYNHNGATSGSSVLAELPLGERELEQLRQFLFAFPSDMAPIVGQQVTFAGTQNRAARRRLDLMSASARVVVPVPECDLVAHAAVGGERRGWVMQADGRFRSDRATEGRWTESRLRELARADGQAVTFTCVPPGAGVRIGIDRDEDGVLDGDEPGRANAR